MTLYLPVRGRSVDLRIVARTENRLARAWMFCVTDGSTGRYRKASQLCSCTVCLPHRQQRLTTAIGCICKCSSGWGKETIWTQKNGSGYECGIALSKLIMTYLQPAQEALLEIVRCTRRHDCDTRRCSCKKHRLDC